MSPEPRLGMPPRALSCVECGEAIDPLEEAHSAHDADCTVDPGSEDWSCWCDAYAHRRCCRYCEATEVVEVEELPPLPMASTRGLPKRRTA